MENETKINNKIKEWLHEDTEEIKHFWREGTQIVIMRYKEEDMDSLQIIRAFMIGDTPQISVDYDGSLEGGIVHLVKQVYKE